MRTEPHPSAATLSERLRSKLSVVRSQYTRLEGPAPFAVVIAIVSVVFSWNIPAIDPSSLGGDRDFWYLMGLASERGIDFANDLATSYGPLFFLTAPSITHPAHVLAAYVAWTLFAIPALSALLQTRRDGHWVVFAVALTFAAAATPASLVITTTPVLLYVLSLADALGSLPVWMRRAFPFFSAITLAVLALNKFSTAGLAGAAVVAALMARPGRRSKLLGLAQFAATGMTTACLLWVLMGQNLLSLPTYVARGLSVGSGYGGALGLESATNTWEYLFAGLSMLGLAIALVRLRPRESVALSWLWVLLMVAPIWLIFKQGFMRHDSHSAQYFALAASATMLLGYLWNRRTVLAGGVTLVVVQVAVFGGSFTSVDPAARTTQFGQGLFESFVPLARERRLEAAQAAIRAEAKLPQTLVAAIGNQPVYVEPFNHSITWAYGLNPAILPTILEYGAYSHYLDDINAAWFENEGSAPRFILRRNASITVDSRNPLWDSPNAKLQEICWYKPTKAEGEWLLLERRSQSICGAEMTRTTASLAAGDNLSVQGAKNSLTVVRLALHPSTSDQLQALLLKPPPLYVTLDGTAYRLPWGDADSPLVVSGYEYFVGGTDARDVTISVTVNSTVTVGAIPVDASS